MYVRILEPVSNVVSVVKKLASRVDKKQELRTESI
jgi:hypothetical protein